MSKQPLDDEMISRLHDWFEIPNKPELYRAVSVWLASVKADAWTDGAYWAADAAGSLQLSLDADKANPFTGGDK